MSAKTDTPTELQSVIDRDAIRQLIAKSCRAMDRADLELFRSCYHDGAWDDHGYYKGPVSEFIPGSIVRPAHVRSVMHMLGTMIIDIEEAVAWAESYFIAYQRATIDGTDQDSQFAGRYIDRLERRDDVWKIARRTVVYDWTRVEPVDKTVSIPGGVIGLASREDLSYARA